jgi:putative protease
MIKNLYSEGLSEVMLGNIGALRAINNLNIPVSVSGSASLNIWNHYTVRELSKVSNRLTLSNELSKVDLTDLSSHSNPEVMFDLVVQGNLESLISEDCLLSGIYNNNLNSQWSIVNHKNRIFPVIVDDDAHTHIMNSVELCLINYIPYLYQMGFKDLIIDARNKNGAYANLMVNYYNQGLNFREITDFNIRKLNMLKNRVKKISQGSITSGNFIK